MLGISVIKMFGSNRCVQTETDQYVVFSRFFLVKRLAINDLVKVRHARYGIVHQQIKYIDSNGIVWLADDENNGLDTLQMGPIQPHMIIGKAVFYF
ncbi:hypothetical protein [Gayadomonas joobiniege]|uniref:hypothetical protein n=1 Tax=Gayadomonas joobiniege TaxID=1234606 RepID=UPI000364BD59|nr:hypothetical protein [Gayadomonas joobiniege]